MARAYYQKKDYPNSIEYYSKIKRFSDYWHIALQESSWAFFMMGKHNNALGNIHTIHSPYLEKIFIPESYMLSAAAFVRLCRFTKAKDILKKFDLQIKRENNS